MIRIVKAISFAVLLALPVQAELVLLDNERFLKVESYRVDGERIHLVTSDGGEVDLPIARIERIVDDEVEVVPTPIEPKPVEHRSWRFERDRTPRFASQYDDWIMELALEQDVDAVLISAVIKAESNYDPVAVSRKGAQGLMQLMPATARRFGVTDPFDPIENIRGGTRYLRRLLDMFEGDVELALAAYNAGEGNVRRYDGIPPFRETRQYVRKIVGYLSDLGSDATLPVTSSRR